MSTATNGLYERMPKQDQLYDVIVAGGGPAAIGAALGAAFCGARTLILEARSQFGGTATAAMWMEINWLFKDNDETDRGGVTGSSLTPSASGGPTPPDQAPAIPGRPAGAAT